MLTLKYVNFQRFPVPWRWQRSNGRRGAEPNFFFYFCILCLTQELSFIIPWNKFEFSQLNSMWTNEWMSEDDEREKKTLKSAFRVQMGRKRRRKEIGEKAKKIKKFHKLFLPPELSRFHLHFSYFVLVGASSASFRTLNACHVM